LGDIEIYNSDHLSKSNSSSLLQEVQNKLLEITEVIKKNNCTDDSLFAGHSGIAIFLAYVNELYNDQGLDIGMESSVMKSLEIFKKERAAHTFCSGFAGVCWGTNHLVIKKKIDADICSLFEEIEPYLVATSENDLEINLLDFMHGGIGAGIYFLERLPHLTAKEHLEKIIYYLEKQKITSGNHIQWINNFKKSGNQSPEIEFDLGLAHGIPSIIYFLSKCYEKNIEREKCECLIEGSVNWLIDQKISTTSLSLYPSMIKTKKRNDESSRLAWCYGDLGIASTIWVAGKTLQKELWKQEAINIMLHASERRNLHANKVIDAGICHGTAGIAQFFNRFYWETKLPIFKEAASYWINETVKMAKFDDGLAGYRAWYGEENGWINQYGLLEGISGIGLVLFSYMSEDEPTWDKCLLLS
jgi:lantibiotic modifying enzyme